MREWVEEFKCKLLNLAPGTLVSQYPWKLKYDLQNIFFLYLPFIVLKNSMNKIQEITIFTKKVLEKHSLSHVKQLHKVSIIYIFKKNNILDFSGSQSFI